MSVKKIKIEEMCDAFKINIVYNDGSYDEHYFSQEDSKTELVAVFKKLGFETEYEEVY